jgi:Na+-translocating ferredoxin:NAD+ oxidoreductase RNF subunit RnfB
MSASVSRRGFFTALSRPFQKKAAPVRAVEVTAPATPATPRTAIIQGRFCIALTSFCSVCVERCPVAGAMTKERGMPMVVADVCTGCGVCHDVCPAPRNAVLMLPRRPSTLTPQPA